MECITNLLRRPWKMKSYVSKRLNHAHPLLSWQGETATPCHSQALLPCIFPRVKIVKLTRAFSLGQWFKHYPSPSFLTRLFPLLSPIIQVVVTMTFLTCHHYLTFKQWPLLNKTVALSTLETLVSRVWLTIIQSWAGQLVDGSPTGIYLLILTGTTILWLWIYLPI